MPAKRRFPAEKFKLTIMNCFRLSFVLWRKLYWLFVGLMFFFNSLLFLSMSLIKLTSVFRPRRSIISALSCLF